MMLNNVRVFFSTSNIKEAKLVSLSLLDQVVWTGVGEEAKVVSLGL
jgi:hypothetical protein